MQTTVQKANSIRVGSWILEIDGQNVWLLENAELEVTQNILSKKAHNWPLPVRKKIESVKFKADLYEIDLETIEKLDWHWVLTTEAWNEITITNEDLWSSFNKWEPIKLANKNWNNSEVTNIAVKIDWVTQNVDTDYSIFVHNWFTYINPLITKTWVVQGDYKFIPNKNKKVTFKDVVKLMNYYEAKFTNTDENWKAFSLTIPKAYNTANLTLGFNSDDDIESNTVMAIELTAFPNHNNELLILYDEQSV